MQQAQENKVVVETEAANEVEFKTSEQHAPVELDAELLRLVGGGAESSPVRTW